MSEAAHSAGPRKTLRRPAQWRGTGLFCGKAVRLSVHPAPPGSGWRWAAGQGPAIALVAKHLRPQPRRSTLRSEQQGQHVQLPEHILAALTMLDVDDCTIRFHDGEAPVLDGSALPFVRGLLAAGITGPLRQPQMQVSVTWKGLEVHWDGGTKPARARTFISLSEAREAGGLTRFPGARPGCSVIFDAHGVSRYGGRPRLKKEPAWHKLVDLLGDLGPYRARGRLTGALHAAEPSHMSNPETIEKAMSEGSINYIR